MNEQDLSLNDMLIKAVREGNIDSVTEYIAVGADINTTDTKNSNTTPLILAILYGHHNIVKMLIKAGANVNIINSLGTTPLRAAIIDKHAETVELLIESGSDIHQIDICERTPLHITAEGGNVQLTQILFKAGADINAMDKWGDTPLNRAAYCQNMETVHFLIKAGANVNIPDKFGNINLKNSNIVKLFIRAGLDINYTNKLGQTLLHKAAEQGLISVMRILIKAGANLYAVDNDKSTPLMYLKHTTYNKYYKYKDSFILLAEEKKQARLKQEDCKQKAHTDYNFDL